MSDLGPAEPGPWTLVLYNSSHGHEDLQAIPIRTGIGKCGVTWFIPHLCPWFQGVANNGAALDPSDFLSRLAKSPTKQKYIRPDDQASRRTGIHSVSASALVDWAILAAETAAEGVTPLEAANEAHRHLERVISTHRHPCAPLHCGGSAGSWSFLCPILIVRGSSLVRSCVSSSLCRRALQRGCSPASAMKVTHNTKLNQPLGMLLLMPPRCLPCDVQPH